MRYYICKHCGELVDDLELDDRLEHGGMALCYCAYFEYQWDKESNCFEPIYFREYYDYTEIPKNVYDGLMKESNTKLRLRMLATVPKEALDSLI